MAMAERASNGSETNASIGIAIPDPIPLTNQPKFSSASVTREAG
jgi:hypothetical protein